MNRCHQCQVNIQGESTVCPLCKSVLDQSDQNQVAASAAVYPDVRLITKRLQFWVRIYAFSAIVLETLLLYFNRETLMGSHWPMVLGVVLFYGYVVLKFAFNDEMEYKAKTITLIFTAIFCIILVDLLTGFDGWSLNYFLPGGVILINAGIALAMIVNVRNWQSYMMVELMTILISILPLLFYNLGLLTNSTMSLAAFACSVFLFLGTFIIGGRRALTELKRRFHVR